MSIKPDYLFIYQNDEAVDRLINQFPFRNETPFIVRRGREGEEIEYEHFIIRCLKKQGISENLRGYKTWQVLIEECLWDNLTHRQIHEILMPMMSPYSIMGGRVVPV